MGLSETIDPYVDAVVDQVEYLGLVFSIATFTEPVFWQVFGGLLLVFAAYPFARYYLCVLPARMIAQRMPDSKLKRFLFTESEPHLAHHYWYRPKKVLRAFVIPREKVIPADSVNLLPPDSGSSMTTERDE